MIQTIKNHNVLSITHNQTMKVISSSERCSSSDRWRSDGPCFLSCEEISQCAKVKYTLEGCVKHRWSAGKIEEWTQNLNWNCHLNAFFQVKLTDIPWFSFTISIFICLKKKAKPTAWQSPAFPRIRWDSWNFKKLPSIFFAENHPQSSMFANFPAFVLRGKPLYGYYQLIWPKKKKPPATESPSVWRKKLLMKEMRVWSLRVFSTLVLSSRNLKDWLSFGIRLMLRELGCLVGHLWSQTSFVGGGQTKHVAGWNMDHQLAFLLFPVCVCVFAIYIYMFIKCACICICMYAYIFLYFHIFSPGFLPGWIGWIFQLDDGIFHLPKAEGVFPN